MKKEKQTPIHDFFSQDHRRVDALLEKATEDIHHIDLNIYNEFRIALLTHIKMEENILFPAAKKANQNQPLPDFARFRSEHAAITTLLAVYPNPDLIKVLKYVLHKHDEAEEKPGGMYDICENLTQDQTDELLHQLKNITPTPVHPPKKENYVFEAAKRVLARAGYDYDELLQKLNDSQQ